MTRRPAPFAHSSDGPRPEPVHQPHTEVHAPQADVRPRIVLITRIVILAAAGLILLAMSLHDVQRDEKGVVFRFGRLLPDICGPGLRVIRPIGDRMRKVSVQTEVSAYRRKERSRPTR